MLLFTLKQYTTKTDNEERVDYINEIDQVRTKCYELCNTSRLVGHICSLVAANQNCKALFTNENIYSTHKLPKVVQKVIIKNR